MFCTFPRYLLCLPVLVVLWTVPPALGMLRRRLPSRYVAWGAGLSAMAVFAGQSLACFRQDVSKPLDLLVDRLQSPGAVADVGVESALDRIAEPGDKVAFDSGYGAFVYPAYGADLKRPLLYLPRGAGRAAIPPDVKWVVIDRKWNVGWSHPGAATTREFFLPARRGESVEDLALARQLWTDPDFALAYNDPASDQWIFVARRFLDQAKR
jgi:hypothetical protein